MPKPKKKSVPPHGTPGSWDYRIVHHDLPDAAPEHKWELAEVYFNDFGYMFGYCGVEISGRTLNQLRRDVLAIAAAFDKPPIRVSEKQPDNRSNERDTIPLEDLMKKWGVEDPAKKRNPKISRQ